MPAPEAGAPDRGQAGCGRRRLREALPALVAELRRPSKSSPGSAVVRAPAHISLPQSVGPPPTEPASLREKPSVLHGPSLSTYCVLAGSRHQQAVGAAGANQACPAPHTGNLMMSPRHRRAAVMCCSSRSQGWAPGCVCRGGRVVQTGLSEGGEPGSNARRSPRSARGPEPGPAPRH